MKPVHILALVFVTAIWGLNFVVAKLGLQEIPPLLLTALRFFVVAILLVPFVPRPRRILTRILPLSVTLGSLHFSLMFVGLTRVDASVASIAIQLQIPFAAILAAIFFKDRLGWRRAAGMALAFFGVVLVAGMPRISGDRLYLVLVILASLVWAVGNVQVKALDGIGAVTLNAWISLFSAPQLLILSLIFEHGQRAALANAGWRGYGALAYMAIMVTIVGYGLWYAMIARYTTNMTMPFLLLVPVFGVLSGVTMLGEPLSWQVILGGLAVVAGVGVIVLRRPKLARPEA